MERYGCRIQMIAVRQREEDREEEKERGSEKSQEGGGSKVGQCWRGVGWEGWRCDMGGWQGRGRVYLAGAGDGIGWGGVCCSHRGEV